MKILQINVFRFSYYSQLVDYIRSHDLDIITMQEVDTGGWLRENTLENLLQKLAQELGYNFHFSGKFNKTYPDITGDFGYGNATL